jgi:hypothetical protein
MIGKEMRWSSGKSTWTLSHCAWKPAKQSVMAWNFRPHRADKAIENIVELLAAP